MDFENIKAKPIKKSVWSSILPTALKKLNLFQQVRIRLIGDPVEIFYVYETESGAKKVPKDYAGPGRKYSRYCWIVIDRQDENLKLVELPITVLNKTIEIGRSVGIEPQNLGGSTGVELTIVRSGFGVNTDYHVTGTVSEFTDKERDELLAVELPDLEILYRLKPVAVEGELTINQFSLPCKCGTKEDCLECSGTGIIYIVMDETVNYKK